MNSGYDYQTERPYVFTDKGQRTFLAVRDFAQEALRIAGAVTTGRLMEHAGSGDSWKMMACVDRLLELEEVREIPTNGAWQHRIFVSNKGSS